MFILPKDTAERAIYELILKLITKGQKKLFIEAGFLDRRGRPPKGLTLRDAVQKAALKDLERVCETLRRCIDLIDGDFRTFFHAGQDMAGFVRALEDSDKAKLSAQWERMRANAALWQATEKRNVNEHLREVLLRALGTFFRSCGGPAFIECVISLILMSPATRAIALKESSVLAKEVGEINVEGLSNLWTRLVTGAVKPASTAEMTAPLAGVKDIPLDEPNVRMAKRLISSFSPKTREKILDVFKASPAVRGILPQRIESVDDPNYLVVLSTILQPTPVPTQLQVEMVPQLFGFIADELDVKGPMRYVTLETQRVFDEIYRRAGDVRSDDWDLPAGIEKLAQLVKVLGPRAFLVEVAALMAMRFDVAFDDLGVDIFPVKWPGDLIYTVDAGAFAEDGPFKVLYDLWDAGTETPMPPPAALLIASDAQVKSIVTDYILPVYTAAKIEPPAQLRDTAARDRRQQQLEADDEKRFEKAKMLAMMGLEMLEREKAEKEKAEKEKAEKEQAAEADAAEKASSEPAVEPAAKAASKPASKPAAKKAAPVKAAAAKSRTKAAAAAPVANPTEPAAAPIEPVIAAKPAKKLVATTPADGRSKLSAAVGAVAGGEPTRDHWPEFLTAGKVHVKRNEVPQPPKVGLAALKANLEADLKREAEETARAKRSTAAVAAAEAQSAASSDHEDAVKAPAQRTKATQVTKTTEDRTSEPVAQAADAPSSSAEKPAKPVRKTTKKKATDLTDAAVAAETAQASQPAHSTEPLVLAIENDVAAPALDVSPRGRRLLGVIRIWSNFINFYPVAEWLQGGFKPRSADEMRHEFPVHGAMSLRNWTRGKPANGDLYVIDVLQGEIERAENEDYRFYADVSSMVKEKRVLPASHFGVYPVVHGESGATDVLKTVLITDAMPPSRGDVLWATDDFLFGPYVVRENAQKHAYVSIPQKDATYGSGVLRGWHASGKTLPIQTATIFSGVDADNMPLFEPIYWVSTASLTRVAADRISETVLFEAAGEALSEAAKHPERDVCWNLLTTNDAFAASRRARIEAGLATRRGVAKIAETIRPMLADVMTEVVTISATGRRNGIVTPDTADKLVANLVKTPEVAESLSAHKRVASMLDTTQKHLDDVKRELTQRESELKSLRTEASQLQKLAADARQTIEDAKRAVGNVDILKPLAAQRAGLEADIKTLELQKKRALAAFREETDAIGEHLKAQVRNVRDVAFEGAVAAKFAEAAAEWTAKEEAEAFEAKADDMARLPMTKLTGKKLVDHLVETLTARRPYAKDDVLNLYLTVTQHFLTIFAGAPGSGKTSGCTLLAEALGLVDAGRFLPVSVERGWTSKRDFIGYWNPLTKRFESADPMRYEAVRMMDVEARRGKPTAPYFMLLDEANLSPMEYYWADFMNVSDERGRLAFLSLGGDTRCRIPDHLRFLATINNDFTTEALSPRLLDRAAIVTLPETDIVTPMQLTAAPLVSWAALTETFGAKPADDRVKKLVAELEGAFTGLGIAPSIRTRKDLLGYVAAGVTLFGNVETPLDYAAMQRLVPKVNAAGDDVREALEKLLTFTREHGMVRTEAAVLDMIRRGDDAMGCYRWF